MIQLPKYYHAQWDIHWHREGDELLSYATHYLGFPIVDGDDQWSVCELPDGTYLRHVASVEEDIYGPDDRVFSSRWAALEDVGVIVDYDAEGDPGPPDSDPYDRDDAHYREYEHEEYLERQQRIADEFSAEYQDWERNR